MNRLRRPGSDFVIGWLALAMVTGFGFIHTRHPSWWFTIGGLLAGVAAAALNELQAWEAARSRAARHRRLIDARRT